MAGSEKPAQQALFRAISFWAFWLCLFVCMGSPNRAIAAHQSVFLMKITEAVLESRQGQRAVSLPHVLSPEDFDENGSTVIFQIHVPLDKAPTSDIGLFIQKVSLTGRVLVNGHSVGDCRAAHTEALRCLHQPQFYLAGQTLWQAGDNVLQVVVRANRNQPNGLSEVILGTDTHVFSDYYRPATFWTYDVVVALQWMMMIIGMVLLMIGGMTKTPLYASFGLASVFYSLSSINSIMQQIYFSEPVTSWFIYSVRMVSITLILISMLEFFAIKSHKLRRALIVCTFLFPAIVAASYNNRTVVIILYAPLLALATLVLAAVVRQTFRNPTRRTIFFCAVFIICFLAGPFDYLVLNGSAAFEQRYLIVYTNAFLLLSLGGLLGQNLAAAHIAAMNANMTLRASLAEQEKELTLKHEQVLALERVNSRIQERESLLREVHDGFGSTLSAAYARLKDDALSIPEARSLISECMTDLHIVLNATDPYTTFADAVAQIRYRSQPLLRAQGMTAIWQIQLDGLPDISSTQRLNLSRILQEAVSNALRHAKAATLTVRCHYEPERNELEISVRDDGVGIDLERNNYGRGLPNMNRRAAVIGASIRSRQLTPGTEVALTLAFAPPHPQAMASTSRT